MTVLLRLLREVSYDGVPIAGARPADLLASLALHRSGASDERLVEDVWGDEPPDVPAKALQVLVSRLRAQCGSSTIARLDRGYRLSLATDAVDVWRLESLVEGAVTALRDDPQCALALSSSASELMAGVGEPVGTGPLAIARRQARRLDRVLGRAHGLALARSGKDAEAMGALAPAHEADPDDVEVLEALLRSEAVAVGAPNALARYDAYRRDLADRLGVDPDPALQRMHRELLAADEPIRSGVQYAGDELLGRSADLVGLRAVVRTGRLTTILGPGGLGKTRIAHVLAREATQPRVHFVELVGISSADDVVSEVGSALGVRNSVTGRRTLTAAQLADVRGRISQELDSVPTLLVLDNCEHVLDAVASLVAFLLATTADLRVVTTSRAPLGIAAERVYLLSQLAPQDGAELFTRRARAVRPDAVLEADVVEAIVARLDGLPLAVELAAARIRTMSAEEVRRALVDRFALLRGHDRTAPARHQTLTAVIGWSWDLLALREQQALAWLSVFHDGFSADGACLQLGSDGPDLVAALVDQSLLSVTEQDGVARYRMLETVREFGAQRLAASGEVEEARAAQLRWGLTLAAEVRPQVFGPRQVEAMDLLTREESNLADILRRQLVAGDAESAVPLLSVLGGLWSITGNHPRFFALADLAERVLVDWEPPAELMQVTAEAVGLMLVYDRFLRPEGAGDLVSVMARLDPPQQPWTRVIRAMFVDAEGPGGQLAAALALTDDPDPEASLVAWQWAAVLAENQGEPTAARTYAERALAQVDESTTTWQVATLHTQLAMLALGSGQHAFAAEHARVAVPLLERLHAAEDALTMRTTMALTALLEGDLDLAERVLAEAGDPSAQDVTGRMVKFQVGAELSLAHGDTAAGLAAFRDAVTAMREVRFPSVETSGLEPWILIAVGTALTAHVRFGVTAADRREADELGALSLELLERLMVAPEGVLDYPVAGMGLASLATWLLARAPATPETAEPGVRLLALAHRFGYNRWFPVMAWDALSAYSEAAAPGRLAQRLEEYADRPATELRPEAAAVLSGVAVTSSG